MPGLSPDAERAILSVDRDAAQVCQAPLGGSSSLTLVCCLQGGIGMVIDGIRNALVQAGASGGGMAL